MAEQDTINQTNTGPGDPPTEALPPPGYNDPSLAESAREWIEHNQTTAMLTAFAAGVFLGVLMRR